uniref:Uncharacterized protein n=1 Tax=Haptolina brevifila TaxID=156173 RepID=A0A7S2NG62_9EUKA|mmetsp:Transcript_7759/g.15832  ORF Transcript_7759/g.15832 Transcript_7759/m.15832 type:complete len:129 (+) Transcript_7759:3-389(+)
MASSSSPSKRKQAQQAAIKKYLSRRATGEDDKSISQSLEGQGDGEGQCASKEPAPENGVTAAAVQGHDGRQHHQMACRGSGGANSCRPAMECMMEWVRTQEESAEQRALEEQATFSEPEGTQEPPLQV